MCRYYLERDHSSFRKSMNVWMCTAMWVCLLPNIHTHRPIHTHTLQRKGECERATNSICIRVCVRVSAGKRFECVSLHMRYSVEAWWRERERERERESNRERATERWRWKERGSEARLGRERHHHRAVEDHRRRRNGESQNWRHHLNVLWSKKARGEGSSLLRGRGCQQKQKRAEFSWTSIGSITRVRYRSSRRRRRSSFAATKTKQTAS